MNQNTWWPCFRYNWFQSWVCVSDGNRARKVTSYATLAAQPLACAENEMAPITANESDAAGHASYLNRPISHAVSFRSWCGLSTSFVGMMLIFMSALNVSWCSSSSFINGRWRFPIAFFVTGKLITCIRWQSKIFFVSVPSTLGSLFVAKCRHDVQQIPRRKCCCFESRAHGKVQVSGIGMYQQTSHND